MIYQFIYGRKNEGYCQINDASNMPFQKSDLLKFESLKSYYFASEINKMDLPQSYYFYNEDTTCGKVGILGKTSYVPGRTSKESGDRDTSFLHKYIFIDEDYQKVLKNPELIYKNYIFCNNIDEYNDNKNNIDFKNIERQHTEYESDINSFFSGLSVNNEMLGKFIYCCLDAFSKHDKRIYCILPSNDKRGSDKAIRLMKLIMSKLPPCIISGVGYLTYSSAIHNAVSNPIPGNISVVFLPRNEENLRYAMKMNEQEYDYIFDFMNNISPHIVMSQMANFITNTIVQCIYNQNENGIKSVYDELNKSVYQYKSVDSEFLGAFFLFVTISKEIKNDKPNLINNLERIVLALKGLSVFQNDMTAYGNDLIITVIKALLNRLNYNEEGLMQIETIFEAYVLCKDIVIQVLSDKSLEAVNDGKSEKVFLVINYPFQNEEINSLLMYSICIHKEYYPVALKIFTKKLDSLTSSRLDVRKKIVKVFEAVDSLYQQYPELAKTDEFIRRIELTMETILADSTDSTVYDAEFMHKRVDMLIESYPDCEDYMTISQNICYKIMKRMMDIELKDELDIFYIWCTKLFDEDDWIVKKVIIKFNDKQFVTALKNHDLKQITNLLKTYLSDQEKMDRICNKYYRGISDVIENYSGEDYDESNYFNVFQYLVLGYNKEICYEIVSKIMSINGVTGIRRFYEHLKTNNKLYRDIKIMLTSCIEDFPETVNKKRKLNVDDKNFMEELGINIVMNSNENKNEGKIGKKSDKKSIFSRVIKR